MRLFCFGYGYSAEALARQLTPRDVGGCRHAHQPADSGRGRRDARRLPGRRPFAEVREPARRHHAPARQHPARPGRRRGAARLRRGHRRAPGPRLGRLPLHRRRLRRRQGRMGGRGRAPRGRSPSAACGALRRSGRGSASGPSTGRRVEVFRLSGIYGPGRSVIDSLRAGTARRIVKPGQVFNRIHVDDIAARAGRRHRQGHRPPRLQRQRRRAGPARGRRGLRGRAPGPARAAGDRRSRPPVSPPWRRASGRMQARANERMRRELGVELIYPTYREGLRALAA